MNFYINRPCSFSVFNTGFKNARVIHTILLISIVKIIARGYSFAHISSHSWHPTYCIFFFPFVSISLWLCMKPLSPASDPPQSSLNIIFPNQERCRGVQSLPSSLFPDLISSLCHHLTSIHSFVTSLLCSLHICLTFLSPLTLYLSASCSSWTTVIHLFVSVWITSLSHPLPVYLSPSLFLSSAAGCNRTVKDGFPRSHKSQEKQHRTQEATPVPGKTEWSDDREKQCREEKNSKVQFAVILLSEAGRAGSQLHIQRVPCNSHLIYL